MSKKSEGAKEAPQEVEPEVMEAPEVITGADRWLAEQRARVEAIAEEYRPHEIASGQDYRDSKRARASARKEIKAVEDARRAQVGAIKDAVRGFEAEVRDLLAPLTGIDAEYKQALAAWERLVVDSRTQAVEAWYLGQGGVVVDAVPFRALWDRYAAEGRWGLYGTTEVAIQEDVTRRVRAIEADLASIDAQPLDEGERMALKQDYLSTLDMGEAMGRAAERRRQREALEEAERRRAEAERQERERAEREEARAREEAERAERSRRERAGLGPEPPAATQAVEEAPGPVPVGPAPLPPEPVPMAPAAPVPVAPEPLRPWVVVVASATKSQMEEVARALSALGVSGSVRAGTVAQVAAREEVPYV